MRRFPYTQYMYRCVTDTHFLHRKLPPLHNNARFRVIEYAQLHFKLQGRQSCSHSINRQLKSYQDVLRLDTCQQQSSFFLLPEPTDGGRTNQIIWRIPQTVRICIIYFSPSTSSSQNSTRRDKKSTVQERAKLHTLDWRPGSCVRACNFRLLIRLTSQWPRPSVQSVSRTATTRPSTKPWL